MPQTLDGYNNAYLTPGWTAQEALPGSSLGINVGLPTGLIKLPVTGSFKDQDGKPQWGMLRATPSISDVVVGGTVVSLAPVKMEFVNGSLVGFNLLSPDTISDANPSSWNYTIQQRVGPARSEYTITVPYPDVTVDVSALDNLDDLLGVEDLPLVRDFTVLNDADFNKEFVWEQRDGNGLDNWRANFTAWDDAGHVTLALTDQNGITLTSQSEIAIHISAAQASVLVKGTYHLVLIEPVSGESIRFLQGRIRIA